HTPHTTETERARRILARPAQPLALQPSNHRIVPRDLARADPRHGGVRTRAERIHRPKRPPRLLPVRTGRSAGLSRPDRELRQADEPRRPALRRTGTEARLA